MRALLLIAGIAGVATTAHAQTIDVIFSEIPADPTSLVPAGAGVPAGTLFQAFDRPYRSPDGLGWIMSADTDLATTEDEIIVLGTAAGVATVVREGTAFGSPAVGELVGLIDRNMGLTDTGQYAFATNTNGPTTGDEYVVQWNGAAWIPVAQEGMPIPGFPTEAYGSSIDSAYIINSGLSVGVRATSTVGALPTTEDGFLLLGGIPLVQEGITIPAGQAGGGIETWQTFDLQDYYGDALGISYIAQGDLNGATTTDDVVVVNGVVVVQEGSILVGPGFGSPVETAVDVAMESDGSWFAHGDNDDQQDWVLRNGVTIAATGEPITAGSAEVFDDTAFSACFFWMAGDNLGNYVVGGVTSNPDVDADAVLALNGEIVLARQGDPVDLDGNGLNDDDVFVNIFNNHDGFLTDAGLLYFTADLIDSVGTALGQGYLVLDTNAYSACPGDITPVPADGVVGFDDLLFILSNWGPCPAPCLTGCSGDIDGDCQVGFSDLLEVLSNWGPC